MNDIAKILSTQGISSDFGGLEKLTPEQELAFEKRRRERINSRIELTSSTKRRVKHEPSTTTDETISRILTQGEGFIRSNFTPSDISIYNYFLNTTHLSHESAVSQERIADEIGVTRRTVSRTLTKLESFRLIKRNTFNHLIKPGRKGDYIFRQHTSYKIPNFMFRKDIAFKLHGILTALTYKARKLYKFIALSLLFANTSAAYPKYSFLSGYVPVNNRYLYKQGISTSKCTRFEENTSKSPPLEGIMGALVNFFQGRQQSQPTERYKTLQQHTQISEVQLSYNGLSALLVNEVVPRLGLTHRGKLHIAQIDDKVLREALDQLKIRGRNDPDFDYRLFINLCEEYINKLKLPPDFDKTKRLVEQYGCNHDEPFYRSHLVKLQNMHSPPMTKYPQQKEMGVRKSPPPRATEPDFSSPLFGDCLREMSQKFIKSPQDGDK